MNTWVTDNVPLAGGAFRQLIVDLYRKDKLMRGELMIRGQRVDLSRIHANLLTVIARTTTSRRRANRAHHGEGEQRGQELFASEVVTSESWRAAEPGKFTWPHHRWLAGTSFQVRSILAHMWYPPLTFNSLSGDIRRPRGMQPLGNFSAVAKRPEETCL